MKAHKIILLITAGTIASTASARDRKLDIEVQIKNSAPKSAASMEQSHFLIRNRQYGLAVDSLRKNIRTQPENASAYSAIAVAYEGLGRPDLARKNFEMALAHEPLEERHYRNLARHLNASGDVALARNVMNDFEIARVQKVSENVKAIPKPVFDITALLTRLDRESVPAKPIFPRDQPDIPEDERAVIVSQGVRITAKTTKTIEPVSTGNGEGNPKRSVPNAPTSGADKNRVLSLDTVDDVDEAIAGIYAGLGMAIPAPESDGAFSDNGMEEEKLEMRDAIANNSPKRNNRTTDVQLVTGLDAWLVDLSNRQTAIVQSNQLVENQNSLKAKTVDSKPKTGGFRIVRQSLGEVLLTSTNADWQVSKPVRTAGLISGRFPIRLESATPENNANQYFASVRSIIDSRKAGIAVASSDVLSDLVLKQIDLAMTDLAKKRQSRLPKIDRGPSPQLRKIAVSLYEAADAARTNSLQPAKQNVRVALFFRTDSACAT